MVGTPTIGRVRPHVESLLRTRDVILVSGKGGTGKSTLVAALSELAMRLRGGALAVELAAEPRLHSLARSGSSLQLHNIDPEKAIGPALSRLMGLPAAAGAVLGNRAVRVFIRASPAIKEMVALDELSFLVERSARVRQPVIVDLPATGHALSLLETPSSVQKMLRVGPLANVARRVDALLTNGARCELIAVTLPEELPINEAGQLFSRCAELGVACSTVVVNQVPSIPIDEADRSLLEALECESDSMARFARAARIACDASDGARRQLRRLRELIGERASLIELPIALSHDPRKCVEVITKGLSQ